MHAPDYPEASREHAAVDTKIDSSKQPQTIDKTI